MTYGDVRRAILLVAVLYLAFHFVGAVTLILFLFYAVFLMAMALNPIVTFFERQRVPRAVGAFTIAFIVLGILTVLLGIIVPPIMDQAEQFLMDAPAYWSALQDRLQSLFTRFPFLASRFQSVDVLSPQVLGRFSDILARIGSVTINAAGGLFAIGLVFILTTYAVANPRPLLEGFLGALPDEQRPKARMALMRISRQVRAWLFATLLLGALVGVLVWIGLTFLDVPNAMLLAVIAFFGEFIPNLGPIAAAIPAVLLALAMGPQTALWVVLFYIIVQQVESQILHPLIMGGRMELHPVTVTFFILVMGGLVGIVGALFAVPTAAIAKILYEEFYLKPRHPNHEAIAQDADEIIAA